MQARSLPRFVVQAKRFRSLNITTLERVRSRPTMDNAALREWRLTHGLSQDELANLLDVPTNTLARWERGELAIRHPRILALALHALALGLKVADIRRVSLGETAKSSVPR